MDFTDQDLIEAARIGGRNVLILGGGRSQGKSYFEDVFLHREDYPNTLRTFEVLKERTSGGIGSFFIDDWENFLPKCVLVKTKSKQSRYVRVWRK